MANTSIPETTSAEKLVRYTTGTKIVGGTGPAWKDIGLVALGFPPVATGVTMPTIAEPMIAWTISGEVEAQERDHNGPWTTYHLKKGSMCLTSAGAPYEFRWRSLCAEPFQVAFVTIGLSLFREALEEAFGADAVHTRLREVANIQDAQLIALLHLLKDEADRRSTSRLLVRGLAQALAANLVRNYTVLEKNLRAKPSALPGFKLQRITDWMTEHVADEFNLAGLAGLAGMSEFHFNRLFKRATGVPPLQYQIRLRMEIARTLLRETKRSVVAIALEVGYRNPSHFAQIFRKENGLTPTEYRRQL